MAAGVAEPGLAHAFRFRHHRVRVPAQHHVVLAFLGDPAVVLHAKVTQADEQVNARPQFRRGVPRGFEGVRKEEIAEVVCPHGFGDHRHGDTHNAHTRIAEVEFKRDARDGRLRIMEINPRPGLWFQLARSAGVDILAAAADDLSGRPIGPGGEQRDGVRWRYGLKDAYAAASYRFRPSASLFPAPEVGSGPSHAAALWDPRDPLPALAEPLLYLAKALRRGRRLTGASLAPPD